jgi:hypothetical protein
VNKFKGLAAALAVAVFVVPSAFAESRHSHETHGRDSGHSSGSDRHDRSSSADRHDRGESRQNWNRGGSDNRTFDRGRSENRSNDRSFNDRNFDRGRSNDRNFNNNNNRNFNDRSFDRGRSENFRGDRGRSFDRGRPFFHEGRVSRYERFGSGFRVWIVGAPYPFFIPEARFRLFPHFRVGLSIRLGGYYNPLGYYDYYDGPYDGGSYYDGYSSPAYVSGDLTGIVESVDYRRGTVLIRDRGSDRIVSVVMRGDDPRFGDFRIGDYVELSGDWTRIGTFEAYRIDLHDVAGYRYQR